MTPSVLYAAATTSVELERISSTVSGRPPAAVPLTWTGNGLGLLRRLAVEVFVYK